MQHWSEHETSDSDRDLRPRMKFLNMAARNCSLKDKEKAVGVTRLSTNSAKITFALSESFKT